jgi:hypothetical protein
MHPLAALLPLIVLYSHLLRLTRRPARRRQSRVSYADDVPVWRPMTGAERQARFRQRHGDAYREHRRLYMRRWRAERRAAALEAEHAVELREAA